MRYLVFYSLSIKLFWPSEPFAGNHSLQLRETLLSALPLQFLLQKTGG